MIELKDDVLVFSFPEVFSGAELRIDLQRTLRIPDDGDAYPLPPGLGRFPIRHVDDHRNGVPAAWIRHGGVMTCMYQSEALWIDFHCPIIPRRGTGYPFAVKIAAGKINAVTGETWSEGLGARPQNYLVTPEQPWLDGYSVGRGEIRQFVAMPLGAGYSAEEQITGAGEHGGLQIQVFPMKRSVFEARFPESEYDYEFDLEMDVCFDAVPSMAPGADMGLAPGGRMKQEIYEDPFGRSDWDTDHTSRCFVHIANSLVWRAVTGQQPPTPPPTAEEYERWGLPWFDYYDDRAGVLDGSKVLGELKSVIEMGRRKGDAPLPENESVTPERVVRIEPDRPDRVREGRF